MTSHVLNTMVSISGRASGGSSGKGSPMRHLERTASDRASPATSETREEVASSASDDSSMLFSCYCMYGEHICLLEQVYIALNQ